VSDSLTIISPWQNSPTFWDFKSSCFEFCKHQSDRALPTCSFQVLLASMASLPCRLCHGILLRKERRTISCAAFGVYE
jgi:hypothetical protein